MRRRKINFHGLDQAAVDRHLFWSRPWEACWDSAGDLSVARCSPHHSCSREVFWMGRGDMWPRDHIWSTWRCEGLWTVCIFWTDSRRPGLARWYEPRTPHTIVYPAPLSCSWEYWVSDPSVLLDLWLGEWISWHCSSSSSSDRFLFHAGSSASPALVPSQEASGLVLVFLSPLLSLTQPPVSSPLQFLSAQKTSHATSLNRPPRPATIFVDQLKSDYYTHLTHPHWLVWFKLNHGVFVLQCLQLGYLSIQLKIKYGKIW